MADHNQQRVLEYLKRTEDQTVQLDPIIRNYDDYQRLRDTFYSLKDNDVQTSCIQDGPQTDEARQQYVEDLVAAMLSTDEAVDAFRQAAHDGAANLEEAINSHTAERKQTTAMATIAALSAFERRLLGWDLLQACEAAHQGHHSIPNGVKHPNDVVESNDRFEDRLQAVIAALKKRKTLSKSLCDSWFMFQWAKRIAIRPEAEAKRKGDNKEVNSLRNKQVSFAARNGIRSSKTKEQRAKETQPQDQPPNQSSQTVQPGPTEVESHGRDGADDQARPGIGPRVAVFFTSQPSLAQEAAAVWTKRNQVVDHER